MQYSLPANVWVGVCVCVFSMSLHYYVCLLEKVSGGMMIHFVFYYVKSYLK